MSEGVTKLFLVKLYRNFRSSDDSRYCLYVALRYQQRIDIQSSEHGLFRLGGRRRRDHRPFGRAGVQAQRRVVKDEFFAASHFGVTGGFALLFS